MLIPPFIFIESLKKGIKKQAYLRHENTPAYFIKISYLIVYEGSSTLGLSKKADFILDFKE